MDDRIFHKACAWSGVVCVTMFFAAFVFAGFIPPLAPSLPVEEVAAHYREHATGIRIGMAIMLVGSMFYASFTAAISGQMRRIGGISATVVYAQLAAGAFACLTFLIPAVFFLVTSFRPERDPQQTYMLNDLSWIMLVIPWPPFMVQNFSFAYAILKDPSPRPLLPRWLGFVNIWAPISFTPGILLPFFKSGPFAWDGIFVFWIPGFIFVVWFVLTAALLVKAIDRNLEGESPA